MTIHEELCRAIWNNTYKHDTLMNWEEIKRGGLLQKETLRSDA